MAYKEKSNTIFHVVDDCQEVRDILKMFLSHAGYEARLFDSAESYLNYFHSPLFTAPIAIIADYHMNGLNGMEMIQQVRKKLPEQQAVISTGDDISNLPSISPPSYFLSKPYRGNELFSLLENLVNDESKHEENLAYKNVNHQAPTRIEYHFYSDQDIKKDLHHDKTY